jgi:pilus assembly protein CpaC
VPSLGVAMLCLAGLASPALAATEIILSSREVIEIEAGKGALVRLDEPAASVFIAEPTIADIQVKSPRLVYVFGVRPGETTLFAVDVEDQVLVNRRVLVTHNLSRLQRAIDQLLPNGRVVARSIEGTVVVSGVVPTPADSETVRRLASGLMPEGAPVINQLAVAGPSQINLRVRVAEVQRDIVKQLGINWNNTYRLGEFTFGVATGNPVAIAASGSQFAGTHSRVLTNGSLDSNLFIDALERENLLTVLAEPNLTATSGETAAFLAGGEFPIPVAREDNEITIDFKQFGVSLLFTPTLVSKDRISLRVRPEVSELSDVGAIDILGLIVPALSTRRAETTVELGSGQSFAIAGLLQNTTQRNLSKFPWIGDIPIIGALFRSDSFTRNESELVIIVTPYIVRPVSAQLAAPTDQYVAPNDYERYALNRRYVERLPEVLPVPRDRDGAGLVGPAGFVLE